MRIALVHYHLQGGGVTRIVWHQQKALGLRGIASVALIGKSPPLSPPGDFRILPGLQYEADRPTITPAELAAQMRTQAAAVLGGPPDLWHVHNHSLGKNLILPLALHVLASEGERLLFHIHDFAEDGRPANYRAMLATMAAGQRDRLARLLYPQADHCHYGVLNRRDYRYLRAAGLDASHLHLLLNPVDLGPVDREPAPVAGPDPLWLYPTRAIRRKNLGEFLLWSTLAPQHTRFATTSGPENPLEQPRYKRWRQVAAELHLPVEFELVRPGGLSFIDLLRRAEVAMTTSVAEGFGMAFLEPWALGVPVCGRNLPEIMPKIDGAGVRLPWTYDRLEVPVEWLGYPRIEQAAEEGLVRNLAAYGRTPAKDDRERVLVAWIRDHRIDFGRLDESMQETVLHRLASMQAQSAVLHPGALPEPGGLRASLAENQCLLASRYTLASYGEALEASYRQVVNARVTALGSLDGEALLDRFLEPERLTLLRVD